MMATVLGEWGGLITSIATLIAVIAAVFQGRRNGTSINDVHTLVNNRSEKQDNRIEQLTQTIAESPNVDVPPRISNGK